MSEAEGLVFVVDDDASIRESLKNLMRSVGLRVEAFASAQKFLRSKRPDVPCCLVLDVRLSGLSGLDLQKRMAAADMEIPIIFISKGCLMGKAEREQMQDSVRALEHVIPRRVERGDAGG